MPACIWVVASWRAVEYGTPFRSSSVHWDVVQQTSLQHAVLHRQHGILLSISTSVLDSDTLATEKPSVQSPLLIVDCTASASEATALYGTIDKRDARIVQSAVLLS